VDIFKFIFEHDLRLEQLSGNYDPRQETKRQSTLEEFLKPVQTYSKFYITGTRYPDEHFGINMLDGYAQFLEAFTGVFDAYDVQLQGQHAESLQVAISTANVGDTMVLFEKDADFGLIPSEIFDRSLSVREKIPYLKSCLDAGMFVIFVEKAHHGFDLHLFSKKNIYESFFYAFKPLISETFRFFSINGKRSKSERLFYFETWSLDRPPHGFEEVFEETVLR
jgi:hypothetical protein